MSMPALTASKFLENAEGIHLMHGEHTLCGDAWDAPETEADWEAGPFRKTTKRTVTCPRCIAIIRLCRYVRIKE